MKGHTLFQWEIIKNSENCCVFNTSPLNRLARKSETYVEHSTGRINSSLAQIIISGNKNGPQLRGGGSHFDI